MIPATTAVADHHEVPAQCRNCGAGIAENYCQHCGQETRLHMPSFMEFAHEFIGHYVAIEGRLWGTFGRLLFRPGALTNEYLAGRRRRYVEPLRLYLTLSILFFALIRFTGVSLLNFGDEPLPSAGQHQTAGHKAAKQKAAEQEGTEQDAEQDADLKDAEPEDAKPKAAEPRAAEHQTANPAKEITESQIELAPILDKNVPGLRHAIENFVRMPTKEKGRVLSESFFHYAPYAMFCLMPLFALYLKLLYLGTGRRYGEHLLFALHTNSFAFVMFAAFVFLPEGFLKTVLFFWLAGYLPWAMRRVYQRSRWGTFWRWSVLIVLHVISISFAIAIAMLIGVAIAH